MEELHKDDIEILDLIVKESLNTRLLSVDDLPNVPLDEPEGKGMHIDLDDQKLAYYPRIFKIIEKYNIATVYIDRHECAISEIPVITKRFVDNGGFKNLYDKQQEELKRKEILRGKEINDAILSKWTKRTYWFTFAIAIIGLILAVWAFIRTF